MSETLEHNEEPTAIDVIIGHNVHWRIWNNRITQREMARVIDISDSVLSKKLRGESAWSAEQVHRVAQYFEIPPGDLFESQPMAPCIPPELAAFGDEPDDFPVPFEGLASVPALVPTD